MVNGRRFRLVSATHGPIHLVEVDGVTHRISRDEGGVVRSPAPALVVATPLAVGDEVEAGAPILVLESMKMENVLRAPFRARVRECPVSVGSQVETGAPLMRLEPLADEGAEAEAAGAGETVEIDLPAEPAGVSAAERVERGLQDLRSLLLGFDVDPQDRKRVLSGYLAARAELGGRPLPGELDLLTVFADLSELSRNKPGGELEVEPGSPVHSPREYFHSYLQSLDVERAGVHRELPGQADAGARALRRRRPGPHAGAGGRGLPDLPGPAADVGRRRGRRRSCCGSGWPGRRRWRRCSERAGLALEHLVEATQVRFPAVSDLARGVVFRWFAQPLLRRNRAKVYAAVRDRPALPGPQPGRAGPRRADPGHGGQRRAAGPADRPADRPARPRTTRRCWRC